MSKRYGSRYRVPDEVENADAWVNFWTRVSLLILIGAMLFGFMRVGSCVAKHFSDQANHTLRGDR